MNNIEPWATKKYKRFNVGDEVKIKQYNYMLFKATKPATIVGINTNCGEESNNAYKYDIVYNGSEQTHTIRADEIENSLC